MPNILVLVYAKVTYFFLLTIRFRAMFDIMEMPMDWPAEVNYHEAKAFCAWKGSDYRLPTEAEHHVMRGPQVSQCLEPLIEFQCCICPLNT